MSFVHRITGGLMGIVVCGGALLSASGLKCMDVELCAVDARDEGTTVELFDCHMTFKPTLQHFRALCPQVSFTFSFSCQGKNCKEGSRNLNTACYLSFTQPE